MVVSNPVMRAKLQVLSINKSESYLSLFMYAVSGNKPYGPQGESEDNTYARYTPSATLNMSITNPELLDKFTVGQKFYVDFTEAES